MLEYSRLDNNNIWINICTGWQYVANIFIFCEGWGGHWRLGATRQGVINSVLSIHFLTFLPSKHQQDLQTTPFLTGDWCSSKYSDIDPCNATDEASPQFTEADQKPSLTWRNYQPAALRPDDRQCLHVVFRSDTIITVIRSCIISTIWSTPSVEQYYLSQGYT